MCGENNQNALQELFAQQLRELVQCACEGGCEMQGVIDSLQAAALSLELLRRQRV